MNRTKLKINTFFDMAISLSRLATCKRAQVGAILLRKDWSIASGGYNGAPPGMDHCTDETCNSSKRCVHTLHAEENALFFCTGDVWLAFITHEPCLNCTRMMARRGIQIIYYLKAYNSMPENERLERDEIINHYKIKLHHYDDNK